MKIVLKKNNTTLLHAVFFVWLLCEVLFVRTIIAQAALMLFVGVTIVVANRPSWSMHLAGYGLFTLWSVLNIASGHAQSKSVAWSMTATLLLNLLFLYAFVCYLRYTKDVGTVLKIYRWVALIFSLWSVVGDLGDLLQGSRLLGIYANRIATVVSYSIIIVFYEIFNTPSRKKRGQLYALIAWFFVVILLTGSRKGLLIPMIGVYILICARKPRSIIKYTAIVAILGGILLFLVLNIEPLYKVIGYRVETMLQYLRQEDYSEGSLLTRDSYVKLGWEMSQYQPIWGYGLDCFRLQRKAFGTYSHNNYIEILYSLGWVGLIAYYAPFLVNSIRLVKNWKIHPALVSLLLAMTVPYLICDYMNITYFERLFLLIPAIVIGVAGKKVLLHEAEEIH